MKSLSIALIAKDEEEVIGRCLESIKDLADEIVVVDTGSIDKTKEICQRYTDKVYDFKWINDFSAARNCSFEHCTRDWIMWLDADDIMREEDKKKIRELDTKDYDIIICPYEYSHDEYDNSNCTVPRERIVRRSKGIRWEKRIHEYLPLVGQRQYISDIAVHHYRTKGSSDRNIKILEEIVYKEKSQDPRDTYYLAREYYDCCKYRDCLPLLCMFVTMPGAFWEDVYKAWYLIALCKKFSGDEDGFKKALFESLKFEDRRAEPYYQMGQYFMEKSQWDRAIHWFKICLSIERPRELLGSFQPEYSTWMPALQLCVCYNNLGRIKEAIEYNNLVLKYRPKDSRALNNRDILKGALERDTYQKEGKDLRLYFSYGASLKGYLTVAPEKGPHVDIVSEPDSVNYKSGCASEIASDHFLDTLPFDRVSTTLNEWFRLLKNGGRLTMNIFDLEESCRSYLKSPIEHTDFYQTKCWYKTTMYGWQKNSYGDIDPIRMKRSGFSKDEMELVLKRAGFVVSEICKGESLKTPTLFITALKLPESGIKIAWVAPENKEAAQTRIRVLNVDRWLKSNGYNSQIVTLEQAISEDYDVVVIGKAFDNQTLDGLRILKSQGKTVYTDLCEDILEYPTVSEILRESDKVVCCSYALENKVKAINTATIVIEDAWE